MITFERSTAAWNGRPEDDVDLVLRGFFQSRMPNPWPAFTPPQALKSPAVLPERITRALRWQLYNRLLLIAASVALLVGAQFLLPNLMSTASKNDHTAVVTDIDPNSAKASTDENQRILKEESKIETGDMTIELNGDSTIIRVEAHPGSK